MTVRDGAAVHVDQPGQADRDGRAVPVCVSLWTDRRPIDGGDPLPANSGNFVGLEDPAFAGASGPVGAELLCLQFRRRARD
jgi:hypothetical protein